MLSLSDDFLGATSSSHLNITPQLDSRSTQLPTTLTGTGTTLLSPVLSPSEEHDATLSVSSDSVSLPTQVEVRPEPVVVELAKKLTEASLEDVSDKTPEEPQPGKSDLSPEAQVEAVTEPEVTVDGASAKASAPTSKPEAAKEEGPQDLRVFELNSDSGKSTPSNNGKKGTMTVFQLARRFSLIQFGNRNLNRIKLSDAVMSFPLNRLRSCSRVKVIKFQMSLSLPRVQHGCE